ncbi:MAG: hypothetical protein FWG14_09920 [Peptococcaceae bacterium]|nr:hypothetical protein [Peptococcaceae bacterium]
MTNKLETERPLLRPLTLADADTAYKYYAPFGEHCLWHDWNKTEYRPFVPEQAPEE